jgi:hypothetical protein
MNWMPSTRFVRSRAAQSNYKVRQQGLTRTYHLIAFSRREPESGRKRNVVRHHFRDHLMRKLRYRIRFSQPLGLAVKPNFSRLLSAT